MKVLVTDYVHPYLIQGLEEKGFQVVYDRSIINDSLAKIIQNYTGVIINSKIRMDKAMMDKAKKLVFIGRLGSGLDIIDLDYAAKKNLKVLNTPTGNNNAVAEHAMGMILSLANNLNRCHQEIKNFEWHREKNRGWELLGKTVGIIGFGHTGSQLAKKLLSWDVNVITFDKYRKNYSEKWDFVRRVSLEDILIQSNIITLHLPLTDETHHLVNKEFISKCQDGVIIVNTSRGKVVDTSALLHGLESEKIGGACLDVFENEKPHTYSQSEINTYKRLFNRENVVVSPHVAGWTRESLLKIATVMLSKIEKLTLVP